jgi:two-component system LytT family response regulator
VGSFTNPQKAVAEIQRHPPHLLLLDIQMPGMTGFELLEKLNGFTGKVIFTTAHSNYAVRAFKFNATDYLLKPIDGEELQKAVAKLKAGEASSTETSILRELSENIKLFAAQPLQKICLATSEGLEIIALDNILFLKSASNYTVIKRATEKELIVAKTLKDFEGILPPDTFMRVHASYIINLTKVAKYLKQDGGIVALSDGTEILIGRSYKETLLKYFKG